MLPIYLVESTINLYIKKVPLVKMEVGFVAVTGFNSLLREEMGQIREACSTSHI